MMRKNKKCQKLFLKTMGIIYKRPFPVKGRS
jgi:hypothetical protein